MKIIHTLVGTLFNQELKQVGGSSHLWGDRITANDELAHVPLKMVNITE
jgi:hypothetical protein